ncbi:MAG TPA: glycosyltransferase [Candidatus Krumholzibacteria bacterium]
MLLLGDARQVHLRRWGEYFAAHGYDVLAASLEDTRDFPTPIVHLAVPGVFPDALRYPLASVAVRRILREFRPDVISAHFVPNYGLMAALAGADPWVLSTWGSDIMSVPDRSRFHRWRTRFVLNRAPWVTSDAQVLTERIRSFGVPSERILTFPYGVVTDVFSPGAPAAEPGPLILSNRKLESLYRVDVVVDAFSAVREALPDAALTIAGDGAEKMRLVRRADTGTAAARIRFVGGVDHAHMPALLREHHIYVSSSPEDTTSVSLLEAMAVGLFPVVTDIPANREWIVDGENGRLVPPGEATRLAVALIDAWRDTDLRERARARNAEIIATRGRWEESMRSVHELFDRLCARNATTASITSAR